MRTLGVALAVVLDAALVRTILVPAAVRIAGTANRWPPLAGPARRTREAGGVKSAPLERDSLLGRYLGDRRFALTLPRAVGLQILHPSVAAAIVAHAPSSSWALEKRTVSRMIYFAYTLRDPHPAILYGHGVVHGVDSPGKRYSGLTPELFFFQHATCVDTRFTAIETFDRPLSPDEKKTLSPPRFSSPRTRWRRSGALVPW